VYLHILDYNSNETVEDVKWAMDYWLSKREPSLQGIFPNAGLAGRL
jgi:hypothetical protein